MDHIRITKIIVTLLFVGALCACQLSQTPTEVNSSSSINQKPEVSETVDKQRVEFQIDGNSYEITEIQHSNQLPRIVCLIHAKMLINCCLYLIKSMMVLLFGIKAALRKDNKPVPLQNFKSI